MSTSYAERSDADSHTELRENGRKNSGGNGLSSGSTFPDPPMVALASAQLLCQNHQNSLQDESVDLGLILLQVTYSDQICDEILYSNFTSLSAINFLIWK